MATDIKYSAEPEDKQEFTKASDTLYTRFAKSYDVAVKVLPIWKRWLRSVLPHLEGPRVLEASFGTGYLLTQYAANYETYGIDYNFTMARTASKNLRKAKLAASLQQANVEALPYRDDSFDSALSTMAFTGYPDAAKAMTELHRVLRPGGKLVMVDVSYPRDGNWLGTKLTGAWKSGGDLVRDMHEIFQRCGFDFVDEEIGGYGSIHLFVATKKGG